MKPVELSLDKFASSVLAASLCLFSFAGFAKAEVSKAVEIVGPSCPINLTEPNSNCSESDRVIEVLKAITKALADQDYQALGSHFCSDVTTSDEGKVVSGREAVLSAVKAKLERLEKEHNSPAIGFTIDHPYANVMGDTAVVSFVLIKDIGGPHPLKFQSHCTDIFIKKEGEWKKLHYKADAWKLVKASAK